MGAIRIDLTGLIAFAFENQTATQAARMMALCPNPSRFNDDAHLHPHSPRLEVSDRRFIDAMNTTLDEVVPGSTPAVYNLEGWDVAVLPDGIVNPRPMVSTPAGDVPDPDNPGENRVLSDMQKLLLLAAITGVGRFDGAYTGSRPSPNLMARVTFADGTAKSVSKINGAFENWRFVSTGFELEQLSAPNVAWKVLTSRNLTFKLTALADPTTVRYVVIVSPENALVRVSIRHTCDSASCGDHRGRQVPVFYDMLEGPLPRRPKAKPPFTEGGYCPPSGGTV